MTNTLQILDFTGSEGKHASGLVLATGSEENRLAIDERAAIFDAQSFHHIDYVFFRRFSDGRSSQVSAYIVDNSDERLDKKELAELHRRVWLHGKVALLYVAWPARIDILTCARGPDFWEEKDQVCRYNPAKTIKTASWIAGELKKRSQFSAFRLADGTFWEDPLNKVLANHAKAAHRSLIQAVVEADTDLDGNNNPVLRRLLLLMVLIKYLEDRRVFPNIGWFGRFHKGAKSFFEVLEGGDPKAVCQLLKSLERKFNGEIFSLPADGQALTKKNLNRFADLVGARTLNRQLYLWRQFSFEHLPVEIISHLYQRFVEGGHGTVYTPPFLAGLLLDHAMPYEKLTGSERILDPACGSGVFLVGAFRRLVNVWRSQNSWRRPDVETLKGILGRSIHGIEMDPSAVDLTAFSLSLAVCDVLQPDVIWRDLEFDRLRNTNLFEADFFVFLRDFAEGRQSFFKEKFDIIIGNPPFESELTEAGIENNKIAKQQNKDRGDLPDNQSAYLFLEQAFNVLRPGGIACLIQPSGFLYNRRAHPFRSNILKKHRVDTILDFTSIRNLYEADPKTVAVFARAAKPPEEHWIVHWTFRRTASVHERICFEIDHYDRHRVSQENAEADQFVWRVNLLGGGRLFGMSLRLRRLRTLAEYVGEKKWDYGEGFIVGSGEKQVSFLTSEKKFLPTTAFTKLGIDESKITDLNITKFESPRCEERFTPPIILIKEIDSLPITFWDKGFITYRDKIVGIHSPRSQEPQLRKLYEIFLRYHEIYRFSCMLNGTQSMVGKSTAILKQDIDLLPFPKDIKELTLSFWEKVLCWDVLEYMADYVRLGQNSKLLKTAAGIDDLLEYSGIFVRMLGSIYNNLKAVAPVFLDGLICQPFYFGTRPNLSWVEEQKKDELKNLIYDDETHEYLRTTRVLRFYSGNVLLIVKPDRLRYWIGSTAIRDADETLVDLHRQGY